MIFGWPFPKRLKFLEDLLHTTTGKTFAVRFQSKLHHMQIYPVSVDLPKYRLKNGRTAAAQIEYLATHSSTDREIFSKDPESDEAQAVQHSLLKGMVNEEGLLDYFKKHEQELPLILTNTGFVVNGNRRLCAMRELYYSEEQEQYERFRTIDVVILPPSDEADIDWLEGKEQIHHDIKANYSWVTTAVMYRVRMDEHKQDIKYVANLYEVNKPDVSEMLDMLAHAETYLKDRGKEGQYSLVEADRYAFSQLRKFRSDFKTEGKKQVYDQLAYTLIEDPEGGRAYQAVADTAKYFDQIVDEVKSEFDIKPEPTPKSGTQLLSGGPQAIVAGTLAVLRDEKKRKKVREIIREVIASEEAKKRESKKANFVHSQVKRAKSALQDAAAAIDGKSSKDGIADLLVEIEKSVSKIGKWIHGKATH